MVEQQLLVIELKGGWHLEVDQANPAETVTICRKDGKFFKVRFNPKKYGQPVIEEGTDADGFAGTVFPIVKCIGGVWHVLAIASERPANDYEGKLLEGARSSVSNDKPNLTASGHEFQYLPGFGYSNSARISGKIRKAVVDVTDLEFTPPAGAEFITFSKFFAESTDMMTQAVIGQFLVQAV